MYSIFPNCLGLATEPLTKGISTQRRCLFLGCPHWLCCDFPPTLLFFFSFLKEPQVQQTAADSDKPVSITATSLPDAQKAAEPSRIEQLRPHEFQRAKDPVPTSAEKPKLGDGHPPKKSLSIFNYVRGPLPKDIPVPLSHSMNGKSKPWEPFIAEEFAHQFHESVLQSTQKALQKHKGNKNACQEEKGIRKVTTLWIVSVCFVGISKGRRNAASKMQDRFVLFCSFGPHVLYWLKHTNFILICDVAHWEIRSGDLWVQKEICFTAQKNLCQQSCLGST